MAKGEFVWGILFGRRLTRSSPKASTICTIPSRAPLIYDTNSSGAIDIGYQQNPQSARRNNFPGEQISRWFQRRWFQLLSENLSASNYPGAAYLLFLTYRVANKQF